MFTSIADVVFLRDVFVCLFVVWLVSFVCLFCFGVVVFLFCFCLTCTIQLIILQYTLIDKAMKLAI